MSEGLRLDGRDLDALLRESTARLPAYVPGWRPAPGSAASALLHIVATHLQALVERLDRAPDKNLLAFLDLLGADVPAAQGARARLVFTARPQLPDSRIPAGTQVAAKAPGGDQPLVFETEQAIALAAAQLTDVVTVWPGRDTYTDHGSAARDGNPLTLFDQAVPVPHELYLAHDTELAIAGSATVELNLGLALPSRKQLKVAWEYFDGTSWRAFAEFGEFDEAGKSFDGTVGFSRGGTIRLVTECGESAKTEVHGISSHWIRARLLDPLPAGAQSPVLDRVRISSVIQRSTLDPDAALSDSQQLDLTKSFLPFGPAPQAGNIFAIASDQAFSKPGATIKLRADNVTLPTDATPGTTTAALVAEVWDGSRWTSVQAYGWTLLQFVETGAVNVTEPLELTLIDALEPTTLNGQSAYWLRIRITGGAFAKTTTITMGTSPNTSSVNIIQPAPPSLANLRIEYEYRSGPPVLPQACLTYSDFQWIDRAADLTGPSAGFPAFPPVGDRTPTLYLGFDRPLPADRIGLHFDIHESTGGLSNPLLRWEYADRTQWLPLTVTDETANLTRPGIVSFAWPKAPSPAGVTGPARFGVPREWIRARLDVDGEPLRARLDGIHLNAVWATNNRTYENERLGSSNGQPGQAFFLRNTPVLPGEIVEVCELAGPRAAVELPRLLDDVGRSGPRAQDVRLVTDRATGQVSEVWVRWHAKRNLHFSEPDSRDYVLERSRGRLAFGGGGRGRLPPPGADNIRVTRYTAGGGTVGNVPADSITELLSGVLAEKVTNPRDAEGGADNATLADVRRLGPQTLRHRRQAITLTDYEALAREASPAVAVARAVPTAGPNGLPAPGWVTVIVVPHSTQPQPQPSFELRRRVHRFLAARTPASAAGGLAVIGPEYLPVGVRAVISPVEVDQAGPVRDEVLGALAYGAWGRRLGRRRGRRLVFMIAIIGTAAAICVLALLPPYPVMLAVGVLVGLLYGPVNPIVNLAMQSRTEERLRGRVVGLMTSSTYAAGPLGFLLAGPLVQWLGVKGAFLALAGLLLACALLTIPARSLHELDSLPRSRRS